MGCGDAIDASPALCSYHGFDCGLEGEGFRLCGCVGAWVGRKGGAPTDASPFLAAIMEPIMSGTDVPTASTRTPITMALTPKIHAAPVASAT